jgi:hypothetical protein
MGRPLWIRVSRRWGLAAARPRGANLNVPQFLRRGPPGRSEQQPRACASDSPRQPLGGTFWPAAARAALRCSACGALRCSALPGARARPAASTARRWRQAPAIAPINGSESSLVDAPPPPAQHHLPRPSTVVGAGARCDVRPNHSLPPQWAAHLTLDVVEPLHRAGRFEQVRGSP